DPGQKKAPGTEPSGAPLPALAIAGVRPFRPTDLLVAAGRAGRAAGALLDAVAVGRVARVERGLVVDRAGVRAIQAGDARLRRTAKRGRLARPTACLHVGLEGIVTAHVALRPVGRRIRLAASQGGLAGIGARLSGTEAGSLVPNVLRGERLCRLQLGG